MENGAGTSTAIETTSPKAQRADNSVMIGSVDMANYPEIELTVTESKENDSTKINGESRPSDPEDNPSDREGALIIDETPSEPKKKKRKRTPIAEFKGFKKRILAQEIIKKINADKPSLTITKIPKSSAPESEIEITREDEFSDRNEPPLSRRDIMHIIRKNRTKKKTVSPKSDKIIPNQKHEYAQYLGLQPALKFKCIRCGVSNFPSLADLNEHIRQCSAVTTSQSPPTPSPNSTNFKITRKVFLCSACGTYYEVWNLFLHMREVHHRHICLLCLGLFSAAEKLSTHLSLKHDAPPKKYETVDEFRGENGGNLFVMCVTCERIFIESDDFTKHVCETNNAKSVEVEKMKKVPKSLPSNKSVGKTKNKILPSEHVTADTSLIDSARREDVDERRVSEEKAENHIDKTEKSVENQQASLESENSNERASIEETVDENEAAINDRVNETCEETKKDESVEDENREEEVDSVRENDEISNKSIESDTEKIVSNTENESKHSHSSDNERIDEFDPKNDASENKSLESEAIANSTLEKSAESENISSETVSSEKNSDEESNADSIANDSIESVLKEPRETMALENKTNECDIFDKKTDDSSNENEQSECSEPNQNEPTEDKRTVTPDTDSAAVEQTADACIPSDRAESANKRVSSADCVDRKYRENLKVAPELSNTDESCDDSDDVASEPRVPKVTLRIPPRSDMSAKNFESDSESDDSLKLTMEIDEKVETETEAKPDVKNDSFPTAGPDVAVIELGVRPVLDRISIQSLLKDFIRSTCGTCAYCNHARKIAVNGKQLGLHMIAEHRFSAIADSITAEELLPETFSKHIEDHFEELKIRYFNLESYDDTEPELMIPYDRTYECFRCRFVTTVHKELYLHNRKMHQKTILLCIMCKSTFYSYSELLCHMCPGNYTGAEVTFRCCLCPVDAIPSAFRLMVHLRKRHHVCDVCLDACGDQSRLSNHVWKHKLHHLCYRCGIAYRNKPDITRHLFWKHGTESVLCKRCLSKKWPHVYHFCAPPVSFACEDCGVTFSKSIALIVHRRLHTDTKPYACTEENCSEKLISKKLLEKHIAAHREPVRVELPTLESEINAPEETEPVNTATEEKPLETIPDTQEETEKSKPVVDVYDLPALNLSESDSDSEDESKPVTAEPEIKPDTVIETKPEENADIFQEPEKPVPVLDGIWDDFKKYQATVEKQDFLTETRTPLDRLAEAASLEALKAEVVKEEPVFKDGSILGSPEVVSNDHAYCAQVKPPDESPEDVKKPETSDIDHDYCNSDKETKAKPESPEKPMKSPKKKTSSSSSSSSSDSDSSSCTCTSNCSCMGSSVSGSSSSSSSDSGSSGSEAKRRAAAKKQRRKERAKNKNKSSDTIDVIATEEPEKVIIVPPLIPTEIHESDLCTTETETDEDFYDEHPHRFAKKIIEEKKNRLILEATGGSTDSPALNGSFLEPRRSSTPNTPNLQTVESPVEIRKKPKVKSKKRKRNQKISSRKRPENLIPETPVAEIYYENPIPAIPRPPLNVTVSRQSPGTPVTPFGAGTGGSGSETDGNLRSSKRRRVPNKFYGYSSDDDSTVVKLPEPPQLEWNKEDLPSPPRIVAPAPLPEPTFVRPVWKRPVPEKQPSSSDSEGDSDSLHIERPSYPHPVPTPSDRQSLQQRPNENLYCYCQCPYDEVSEMIACDAKNCKIEWFHFECVGIMVPPKGKWYCPDCRSKQTSSSHPRPSEYFMS